MHDNMRGLIRLHAPGSVWCYFFFGFICFNLVVDQVEEDGSGGISDGIPTDSSRNGKVTATAGDPFLPTESPLLGPDNAPPTDLFFRRTGSGGNRPFTYRGYHALRTAESSMLQL